jgi:DNA-binding response OmpR family regulator
MSSLTTRPPILVVEPDLALRTGITYILRKEGHFVLALGDLHLACEVARENPLSLIVLDPVHLDGDELALCRLVRANPLTQYLPIVLLLTREREITQVEQLGLRITDYLLKPLLWEELRACIQALLRGRKQEGPPRRAKTMTRLPQNTSEESQEDCVRHDATPIFEKRNTHAQSLDHPACKQKTW